MKERNIMFFNKLKSTTTQDKFKGFTLAETLITLVVIGVVAALTVPTLIVKHQKEETVTRLKKAYSAITQTTAKAVADNGPIESWDIEDEKTKEFVEKYLAPYLSIGKDCGYESTGDCLFEWAYLNSPKTHTAFDNTYYRLILADGTSLLMKAKTQTVRVDSTTTLPRDRVAVYIDINGQKGPNVHGKDIFYFVYWIKNDFSIRGYTNLSGTFLPNSGTKASTGKTREDYTSNCNKNGTGTYCTALIMYDNWQIKDDYPW